jgi:hypothetical protein
MRISRTTKVYGRRRAMWTSWIMAKKYYKARFVPIGPVDSR